LYQEATTYIFQRKKRFHYQNIHGNLFHKFQRKKHNDLFNSGDFSFRLDSSAHTVGDGWAAMGFAVTIAKGQNMMIMMIRVTIIFD